MEDRHARIVAIALASLSLIVLSACGGADSRRAGHMAKGQEYFKQENFAKARVEFQNALQINPNDADARFMVGRVAEKLGDIRGAAGQYQGAIDANPEHVQARANLGRMFVFGGAAQRALEVIKPALAKHPDDADLLDVRASARVQLNDRAGALADATRAHQVAPQHESTIALLASLYRMDNDRPKAMALLKEAIDKNPKTVDLRQILATLYAEVEQPEPAIEQLRAVIALKPKELVYRRQLAIYLSRLKRVDDAEKVLKEAVDAAPDSNDAKLAYVDFVTAQRSGQQGTQTLRDFIARNPKDLDLRLGLGLLLQRNGDSNSALTTYAAIVDADSEGPKGIIARNRIAAIAASQGRFADALKLIGDVLSRNAGDNDALVLRGNIRLQQGDATGAIADLRSVLRDQPTASPLLRALARAHLANSEPALAEEALQAAVRAAPRDNGARSDLAQVLMQTNRTDKAVRLLEEALKTEPSDTAARELLVRAYVSRKDLKAAKNAAEDLKAAAPKSGAGFYLAALIAQAENRLGDAEKDFQQAMTLQPASTDALAGLVQFKLATGKFEDALAIAKIFSEAYPKNGFAQNLYGEIYLGKKDFENALVHLGKAVELAPAMWAAHRNIALAKLATGDDRGALGAYEKGIAATNYSFALVADLASLYEQQKRPKDAIALYEQVLKREPKSDAAANNLAMLLVTYQQDQPSLDRAHELSARFASSNAAAFLDTYGWVRLKRGAIAEALPALERASAQAPDSRVLRYHLAMAQVKAGQPDKAIANLETALKNAPIFAGANEARTTLQALKHSNTIAAQ